MSKKLDEYTKEELIQTIRSLKGGKKFGLVWEDKPEQVAIDCEKKLPVLKEVKSREINASESTANNLIIEGDNYHSLSTLNYTHANKIDVIYIDPPYNTGARDWKYNNDFVDSEDTFRHSKWLSLMDKRLRLAKNLLKTTGIIVVTIDDYEIATLRLLMNEIYGFENYLGTAVIRNNPSGRSTVKGFSVNHEYALFYSVTKDAKLGRLPHSDDQIKRYKEKDDTGYFEWENFRKNGTDSNRKDRPKQFYPLIYNSKTQKLRVPDIKWNSENSSYDVLDEISGDEIIVLPVNNGVEKVWKYGLERASSIIDEILVKKSTVGIELYRKKYLNDVGSLPRTWWDKPGYSARDNGTRTLADIFGSEKKFDFPKAPEAVEDCLRVANVPKDGIVLDFFAGSGTTGHAVLALNSKDGGNRQFILCTNNENDIAEKITYERVKKVIEGYGKAKAIPSNLRYFKTDFVDKQKTNDQTRLALIDRCTDMIRVREDAYEFLVDEKKLKLLASSSHNTAIIFDPHQIEKYFKQIEEIDHEKPLNAYIFSYSSYTYDEDIPETKLQYTLCPIPESILEVYRRIFREENDV